MNNNNIILLLPPLFYFLVFLKHDEEILQVCAIIRLLSYELCPQLFSI